MKGMLVAVVLGVSVLSAPSGASHSAEAGQPQNGPLKNAAGIEFARIEAGGFWMGCSAGDSDCDGDEKPRHRVYIRKGFELGKYEVTQGQWQAVMGSNPSRFKGDSRPVETVSWNDAQEFIKKLNTRNDGYRYRLPTEAEWEYAARAGSEEKHPGGSLDSIAWYDGNAKGETHPVGEKKPNAWGMYDMIGNVWEWVQDSHAADYYKSSPAADPAGPSSGTGKVLRGGSWNYNSRGARVSYRNYSVPGNRDLDDYGFRVLREAIP